MNEFITPDSSSDVVSAAGLGNNAQKAFGAEYNAFGIKTNPAIPLSEQSPGNRVGVPDPLGSGSSLAPASIASDGTLANQKVFVGATWISIDSGESIQQALDSVHQAGGGTVYLKAGTYKPKTNLVGYSSVALIGISPDSTIIDFGSTSNHLSLAGTNIYTTGTITSITSHVFVSGSGTSWLANVTAGQHLFVGTRWYEIAAVTSDTSLILSEGYGDNVTFPSTYRIASVVINMNLEKFTIKNSTGTGLTLSDTRKCIFNNITTTSNNIGASFTNCSEIDNKALFAASNTSDGVQLTNVGLIDWSSCNSIGNGGNGFTLNNVKTGLFLACVGDGNTGDGFNITTGVDLSFLVEASANGGQGVEMVSNCSDIDITNGLFQGNTSDGIKLTASCTRFSITSSSVISNGGYGINIVDSSSSNNYIVAPSFASNTSGNINDQGTNTSVITVGATKPDVQIFTSSGTWTKPSGAKTIFFTLVGAGAGGTAGNGVGSGSGGGGGALVTSSISADVLSPTESVTIGAAGTGGLTNNAQGTDGGDSSVTFSGTTYTAGGGKKGAAGSGAGGVGGTSTNGNGITGGVGGSGTIGGAGTIGGDGGGAANGGLTSKNPGDTYNQLGTGGVGATTGGDATNYGAGGGGGGTNPGGTFIYTGGNGTGGYAIITTYF